MHTDPEGEFDHDGGTVRVYRHVLVGHGPYWYVTWERHGVTKLTPRSGESVEDLRREGSGGPFYGSRGRGRRRAPCATGILRATGYRVGGLT
jgi:hypothetical protein